MHGNGQALQAMLEISEIGGELQRQMDPKSSLARCLSLPATFSLVKGLVLRQESTDRKSPKVLLASREGHRHPMLTGMD